MMTLKGQKNPLADPAEQLKRLREIFRSRQWTSFREKLTEINRPLQATGIKTLQVNVGKLCNQTCRHCHVDAGPDRREQMSREIMDLCIDAVKRHGIPTVDITGGAPELNPHFEYFVASLSAIGTHVMVRSNLTVLTLPRYANMPGFFAENGVEVISSLPFYNRSRTDSQRGEGVFDRSIEAIRKLNDLGYAAPGSGLILNLVYNPTGTMLPGSQSSLEQEFRKRLHDDFGIRFNRLFTITNMPISRFLEALERSGKTEEYMERLIAAFNPAAVNGVMCCSMISVGYDGKLYDCDFNQMLELPTAEGFARHIRDFDDALSYRPIVVDDHCWGCTAGAGSSCGGAII
jgi:radical SAM/Cys-rich protein